MTPTQLIKDLVGFAVGLVACGMFVAVVLVVGLCEKRSKCKEHRWGEWQLRGRGIDLFYVRDCRRCGKEEWK